MTTTDVDADRLRSLVGELERLLAGPEQRAVVNPDGTPGHVVAGELIESAWGNAVSDTFPGYWLYGSVAAHARLMVTAGSAVYTLSAQGTAVITYPQAFAVPAVAVNVQSGDIQLGPIVITIDYGMSGASGTSVQIRVRNPAIAGCPDHANQAIRVVWMAIGKV